MNEPLAPEARATTEVGSKECHVCLGPHNKEIHDATVRVRIWFLTTQVMPRPIEKPAPSKRIDDRTAPHIPVSHKRGGRRTA